MLNGTTIFKVVFILLFFSIGGQTSIGAQTITPFETVFNACKKTCEALDGGFASGEQLLEVSKTLRDAIPVPLVVKQTKGATLSLKGHLVFDYEFIQACINNETIYDIADRYAAEARKRGDKTTANSVRLDTKMVPAGQTCTFEIPSCSGTSQIGCVAEVNRVFSWEIETVGYQSKKKQVYKDNDNARKGLPFRKKTVRSDERYKIILSITNKSERDGSFALILF